MYSSKWIHRIQSCWIITSIICASVFIKLSSWSLWISVPVGIIGLILISWTGISIISLFDYNHRMAIKNGIKIENLPLYFSIFERLVKLEKNGMDSSEIPSEIVNVDEWKRFCRWQLEEQLHKINS